MAFQPQTPSSVVFRANPDGAPVTFTRAQYCRLALYYFEQREKRRPVTTLEMVLETKIEQAQARLSEMRKLGFDVKTVDLTNPRKGDRRKLYILSDGIVRVEEADGGNDGK